MGQISPVYMDGPLLGKEFPVPETCRNVMSTQDNGEHVQYTIREFVIGLEDQIRTFLIASVWEHTETEAFVALLSEQAKKAMYVRTKDGGKERHGGSTAGESTEGQDT